MFPFPSPLMMGSVAPSVWTQVFFQGTPGSATTGWAGWTMRQRIPASAITDVNGSQVRFTLRPTVSAGVNVSKMYVGLAGAGTYDFASTPTQAFFGGSATGSVAAGTGSLVCDGVALAYTGTADLMVSVFFAAAPATSMTSYAMTSGQNGQRVGDFASSVTVTGFSASAPTNVFQTVEGLVP